MLNYDHLIELGTALAVVVSAFIAKRDRRQIKEDGKQIKADVAENTQITRATHDITNGSYTLLLERFALVQRRLASMSESPQDVLEAAITERLLEDRLRLIAMQKADKL